MTDPESSASYTHTDEEVLAAAEEVHQVLFKANFTQKLQLDSMKKKWPSLHMVLKNLSKTFE